jgi:hypothetical protein
MSDILNRLWHLPIPEPQHYPTLQALFKAHMSFARENGYGLVKKVKVPGRKYYLKCSRFGQSEDHGHGVTEQNRIRHSTSRKCGCTALIVARFDVALKKWMVVDQSLLHNHPPDESPSAAAVYRRFSDEQLDLIDSMDHARAPPHVIYATVIQTWPGHPGKAKDVNNAIAKVRRSRREGLLPAQALVRHLQASEFDFAHATDPQGRLTHLFFAMPQSLDLLHKYSSVIFLDATYRTNRHVYSKLLSLKHFLTFFPLVFDFPCCISLEPLQQISLSPSHLPSSVLRLKSITSGPSSSSIASLMARGSLQSLSQIEMLL